MIRNFFRHVFLYISTVAIITLLLTLSYKLPNDNIRLHIQESLPAMIELGLSTQPLYGNENANNIEMVNSETRLLNTALRQNDQSSAFVQAMKNSWYQDGDPLDSLSMKISDDSIVDNNEYTRYWEAEEIFIRPLLEFFNYYQIKYFFSIFMAVLTVVAIIVIANIIGIKYGVAFIFSLMCIQYVIVINSYVYSGIYIVMMVSILSILYSFERDNQNWMKGLSYIYMLAGTCTCCFDILTTPLITLGVPLIITTILLNRNSFQVKQVLKKNTFLSIVWGVSYGATFGVKWLLASVALRSNELGKAMEALLHRTNGEWIETGIEINAIRSEVWNILPMLYPVLIAFYIMILIIWIVWIVKHVRTKQICFIENVKRMIPIMIVCIYPYIWYYIFQNHSIVHSWMTYRNQFITLFGVLSIMIMITENGEERYKRSNV